MADTIVIPRVVAERIRREAEKLGVSLEEYVIELLSQNLDPLDRAREYIEASKEILEEAKGDLEEASVRQASEKIWGSAALAVKAYAYWREGKMLPSHGELWEYSRVVAGELGDWILEAWNQASGMHTCFYEGWCTREHVEKALKAVEEMVEAINEKIRGGVKKAAR